MPSEGEEEEEEREEAGRNAAGCCWLWPPPPLLAKSIHVAADGRRMTGTMSAAAVALWLGSGTCSTLTTSIRRFRRIIILCRLLAPIARWLARELAC